MPHIFFLSFCLSLTEAISKIKKEEEEDQKKKKKKLLLDIIGWMAEKEKKKNFSTFHPSSATNNILSLHY